MLLCNPVSFQFTYPPNQGTTLLQPNTLNDTKISYMKRPPSEKFSNQHTPQITLQFYSPSSFSHFFPPHTGKEYALTPPEMVSL